MSQFLTVWGDNSNRQLEIPNRLGVPVGLNLNLVSGNSNTINFALGLRHGLVSSSGNVIYTKRLTNQNDVVTGYQQIPVPVISPWGDNSFSQLDIQRGNFFYEKYDLGIDTTYIIDLQLGLIHGYGYDLLFSEVSNATGEIVNWADADFFNNGFTRQNLLLYPRGFKDVKAGDGYVLALDKNNKITGWGNSSNPVISGKQYEGLNPFDDIKQIAAGKTHSLVLFDNGLISGWGDNSLGQLNFNDKYFFSGAKISTKVNYNLAMGLKSPVILSIKNSDVLDGVGLNSLKSIYTSTEPFDSELALLEIQELLDNIYNLSGLGLIGPLTGSGVLEESEAIDSISGLSTLSGDILTGSYTGFLDLTSDNLYAITLASGLFIPYNEYNLSGEKINNNSFFGKKISSNYDGSIILSQSSINNISGKINIFTGSKNNWSLKQVLSGDRSTFGFSLSNNHDASIIAVGSYSGASFNNTGLGLVYIYTGNMTGNWRLKQILSGDNSLKTNLDYFGWSVAVNSGGNTICVGGWGNSGNIVNNGALWIYTGNSNNEWRLKQKLSGDAALNLTGQDYFGWSVATNNDASVIAVGGTKDINGLGVNGAVWLYTGSQSTFWDLKTKVVPKSGISNYPFTGINFGDNIALSANGNILAVNAPNDGSGYLFFSTGSVWLYTGNNQSGWSQKQYINYKNIIFENESSFFANSISLNGNGNMLSVGNSVTNLSNEDNIKNLGTIFTGNNSVEWREAETLFTERSSTGINKFKIETHIVKKTNYTSGSTVLFSDPENKDSNSLYSNGVVYVLNDLNNFYQVNNLGLSDWTIKYFGTGNNISGIEVKSSLDRNNWSSTLFPTTNLILEDNVLLLNNFPTGDDNYYVKIVEYYDTSCENTGWKQQTVSSTDIGFRGLDMSFDGQYQTFVGVSGGQSYPFISSDYGKSWAQITGTASRPGFWNGYAPAVKLSKSGNLQLIAGPRTASSGPSRVFLSYDFGNNWTVVPGSHGDPLSYMDASDDFKVIAIPKLSGNFISISHNSGATWFHATGAGSRNNWSHISTSDDGKYILAAVNESNQALFKSATSGVSWTSTSGVLSGGFIPVKVSKNGQIQLAGATSDGRLHISRDYGSTWQIAINDVEQWLSIDISDDNKYLLATTNNQRFYRSENSGVSWGEIDLSPFYGVQPPVGTVAISSDGRYQSVVHKSISAGRFVYTNCNFGLNPVSGTIQNTGSTSIYNSNKNIFDRWTDYRVFGWGGGDPSIAVIPESLKNERIIDIVAGYENNLVLTENPIAIEELRVSSLVGEFLSSRLLVTGAAENESSYKGDLFNQIYTLDSVINEKPSYRYFSGNSVPPVSTSLTIFWNDIYWGIYSGFNLIYYNPDDVLYPWLSQNWLVAEEFINNFEYLPAPTSVFEISNTGVSIIIPPCTGFIFDTDPDFIFGLRLQPFNATTNSFETKWNTVVDADGYSLDISTDVNFNNFVLGYQNKPFTGQNSDIITGLTSNTNYYGRVKAVESEEVFVISETIEQLTRLSAPNNLSTSSVTSSSFFVNWGPVVGATNYRIDVSRDPSFLTTFEPGYRNLTVNGTSQLINALTAATTYYIRVRAVNAFGTSANSSRLTGVTLGV